MPPGKFLVESARTRKNNRNLRRSITKRKRNLELHRKRQGILAALKIAEKNRIRSIAKALATERKLKKQLQQSAAAPVAVRSSARLAARRAGVNNTMNRNRNGNRSRRAAAAANNYSKRNAKARKAIATFGKKKMNKPIPFQAPLTPVRENAELNELATSFRTKAGM